jgi:hypothetical protein
MTKFLLSILCLGLSIGIAMRATEVTAILVLIPPRAAYNAIAKLING